MHITRLFSLVASLALVLSLLPLPVQASGTVSLAALDIAYTQDFNTLSSVGTASIVPDGWDFSESGTNANTLYTAGSGSSATGDTYSFGAAANSERAFGTLRSSNLLPILGAQFTNDTGHPINSLAIAYTGEQWRLGQNTAGRLADRLDFQLSTNASSLTTGTWTDVNELDFNSPLLAGTVGALDGNTAPNRAALSATISELSIGSGSSFWVRWVDSDLAPGSDDGLSVDDFSLTPSSAGIDGAPAVSATLPADGAANVSPNSSISITFNEAVDVTGTWFTLTCAASGAHTAAVSGGPVTFTLVPAPVFSAGESCTLTVIAAQVSDQDGNDLPDAMAADFSAGFTTAIPIAIHDVQGAGHSSPRVGQAVTLLPAFVTALRTTGSTRGFYLQDPNPDADPATSEGIFVYTGSTSNPAALVAVGNLVEVSGTVSEYKAAGADLRLTEIVSPVVTLLPYSNLLLEPVVLGAGGRVPPSTTIEDDASGSVETSGVFDPATDGIDFYESLEGMLVQVNDAAAVGPTSDFTSNREIPVVGDFGAAAGARTSRGGVVIQPNDFNPERIILNDWISGEPILPPANVGDTFPGSILGVIDYSFSNFKLQVISLPALVSGGLVREVSAAAGLNQLSAATFNVENLDPTDPPNRFAAVAAQVVTNLRSPDILAIEEIQDNSGAAKDGVVDASVTWSALITAIQAAGGPAYDYRQIDPLDGQDGGEPGGNIRAGFLFRTDRGLSFVDRPGGTSILANAVTGTGAGTQLVYSPGRIDPTNAAFNDSRKPLAGEFLFNGHRLFVIANHWNSKGGDQPLFGANQPPTLSSEVQRNLQAAAVNDFVDSILTANPSANLLVMGDLNDFQFSTPLATLKGSPAVLSDLVDTLPLAERYTYVYQGNSQALDHILASNALMARIFTYDVVHVNAEFAGQVSDHDPQTLIITLNDAPTVDAGGPYTVIEGSTITLTAAASDFEGGPLTYTWDLDNNGTFETPGQSVSFTGDDAWAINTVKVQVTDTGGLTAVDETTVNERRAQVVYLPGIFR